MNISDTSWIEALAFLGAGLSVGLGAISVALGEGYAAGRASEAIAKNPAMMNPVMKNMLIGQAVGESAGIFALVVAMMLAFMSGGETHLVKGFAFLGAGLSMGLAAMGSGLGSGFPAGETCAGTANNPPVANTLSTAMLIGSAMCQTPSIFGMVIAFMLVFLNMDGIPASPSWAAMLGAGLCMGLSAIGSGLGSGMSAGGACEGITRQPAAATAIRNNMLVGSAVSQTPAIFGMVVAFMLLFMDWSDKPSAPYWAILFGAALATGLSAIGPGLGNGFVALEAANGVARMPDAASSLTTTMLIGQTVAQSTVIYGFLVSLILMFVDTVSGDSLVSLAIPLSAGICMGIGGIGPGVGEGLAAAYAVRGIARDSNLSILLTRTMLVGQAVTESTGIYSLIVALVLLFIA